MNYSISKPMTEFVRVHRSTIVNVTQNLRVELFGNGNYQLLLKNGVKLKVSSSRAAAPKVCFLLFLF